MAELEVDEENRAKHDCLRLQDDDLSFCAAASQGSIFLPQHRRAVAIHYALSSMDTLDSSEWDVVISGTGFPQSLLALYVHSLPPPALDEKAPLTDRSLAP